MWVKQCHSPPIWDCFQSWKNGYDWRMKFMTLFDPPWPIYRFIAAKLDLPSGKPTVRELENGPVEIVGIYPLKKMADLSVVM